MTATHDRRQSKLVTEPSGVVAMFIDRVDDVIDPKVTHSAYDLTSDARANDHWPSSRERAAPAFTASTNAARTPRRSSSRRPAAVVPPGEVTAARSAAG